MVTSTEERSPLVTKIPATSSGSNFYFACDDNSGESSSVGEIINMLPKNTISSEFFSRPVYTSSKRKTTYDGTKLNTQNNRSNLPPTSALFPNHGNLSNISEMNAKTSVTNLSVHSNSNARAYSGIEPKLFHANERTFLAWLHPSVVLAGTSIAILALGNDENPYSFIYGILLLPVAISFLLYSMIQYMRRSAMIRRGDTGSYEDTVGPTILTIFLMLSVMAQFSIKVYSISV